MEKIVNPYSALAFVAVCIAYCYAAEKNSNQSDSSDLANTQNKDDVEL